MDAAEVERRRREGVVARGRGLVAGLLMGALEHGVDVRVNARARRLRVENDRVVGVDTDG